MPPQLGIGVVGLDHWYTVFGVLDEATKRRGLKLVAVSDPSRSRLAEVERDYSPVSLTTDYREVIDHPGVDLVCSLANTRDSVTFVRAALQAGKHVACVKPMAMTLRQADSLIDLAESNQRVLWSFDQLGRGRAATLKALISRGAIGTPISYHEVAWSGLPRPWRDRTGPSWWVDETLVPFGAWGDHAIYTIDILRFLFDAGVESVHAEIGNKRYPKMKLEDYGAATLRLTNGVTAVMEHTWVGKEYYPHWTKIVGTKGVIHMDQAVNDGRPTLFTPKGAKLITVKRPRGGTLGPVVSLLQDGAAKPSPARESRANLAAAFAAYKSAKLGRLVTP